LGLTQAQLGVLVGVSQVMLRKWERGDGTPGPGQQEQLSAVLGCPVAELLQEIDAHLEVEVEKNKQFLAGARRLRTNRPSRWMADAGVVK
jgi:transcriptional regulator with XRE-family HTH domain